MRHSVRLAAAFAALLCFTGPLWAQKTSEGQPKASLGVMVDLASGDQGGLTVREAAPNGPAAKAGIAPGDVIVKAEGKSVKGINDLYNVLANHKPGDKLNVEVLRDGKEKDLTVTLGQPNAIRRPRGEAPVESQHTAFLGVQTQPVTPDLKNRLNLATDKGALVTEVVPDSAASKAGLKTDDVITTVNGKAVSNPDQLREAIREAGPNEQVTLGVQRGQEAKELKAKLGETTAQVPSFPQGFRPPEGFPPLQGPVFNHEDHQRVEQLQKQIDALQKRVQELEQKLNKSGGK